MPPVTQEHFGGHIILTVDKVHAGSSFQAMTEEVHFNNYRYPGGTVTESQTWENGGLARMFGNPIDETDSNYVLTIRQALNFAQDTGAGMTIVIPTFQFFNSKTDLFDHSGFGTYLKELERALSEYPDVRINDFEIGNEYWAKISASDYGKIANEEIPLLDALGSRLATQMDGWVKPGIGIQTGVGWRAVRDSNGRWHPTGCQESNEIADEIDIEHREMVTTLYQHAYPNALKGLDYQRVWSMDPIREMKDIPGFSSHIKVSISEYNVSKLSATGVHQGAIWIDEFAAYVDSGVDEYLHWGLNYKWLSNKFYDEEFPRAESDNGEILTKATPMGQIYDLASAHLPGKATLTDSEALEGLDVPANFIVTGFRDAGQKIVFLHNDGVDARPISFNSLPENWHVSVNHLVNADSPYSTWNNEAIPEPLPDTKIADARGDMKVLSGEVAPTEVTLNPGEMVVLVVSEPGRDLLIEGAHNETDYRTGMVDDAIYGGTGNDILRGHVGDDIIAGGQGGDVISSGKGNDTVEGGSDADIIFSGRGSNEIDGGEGDDLFIVSGGRGDDHSTIITGKGNDLILISPGQNLTIKDFEGGDRIGFDGAFQDIRAFKEATRNEGGDLIVDLPGGGMVRVIGQATKSDNFHNQVVDFRSTDHGTQSVLTQDQGRQADDIFPAGESMLDGYSYEQLVESYDLFGTVDGLGDETGVGTEYWLGLGATIKRTGVTPYKPEPYKHQAEDREDRSTSEDDDQYYPADIEREQYQGSAAGGPCFVATAAYGDRMHPDVIALRKFRDNHLVKYRLGRSFVRLYWRIGPVLAEHTKPEDPHANMARIALTLLVKVLQKLKLV